MPQGGFPSLRHNEIRDLTANLLFEVCSDVCTEPSLQPLSGEHLHHTTANREERAWLDIVAHGFWGGNREKSIFDVRFFNPYAPSNRQNPLSSVYAKHEKEKKRVYGQRVRDVEFANFIPLVLSLTGGMGREATCFYKRLASLLSSKWEQPYSTTINWIRCCLSFALLRSSIHCIRGAHSSCGQATRGLCLET